MADENGGAPDGAQEQPQEPQGQVEIPVLKEVVYDAQGTQVTRQGDGLRIRCKVVEGAMPIFLTLLIGKPGKDAILREASGGIVTPDQMMPGGPQG